MIPLKTAKKAAQYLREFVRANTAAWGELMRGVNPKQGYGHGQDVADAFDAAMFLYHETDEHFLQFEIPGEFASGEHLFSALERFDATAAHYEDLLRAHLIAAGAAGGHAPQTIGMVTRELEKARFGVKHAISMLSRGRQASTAEEAIDVLRRIATRFPDVVAQLERRRADKKKMHVAPLVMTNEYDVQYLFQALLRLEFADVRPEEATPSTAGGSARADTLLKEAGTIVEFKMTREKYDGVALRKEVADDFVLYAKHPDCKRMFIFVYDPTKNIANPRGVEADLSVPRPPIGEVVTFIQQN
ncbi:hypothetical protein [uncultured Sphingomonas sp.]|uniref:PD-(D/E)XK nuclease domain-containing protein n=1 Tax=uncultured Sphingomonas sp. TaxID=158754 RepID=UPI003748BCD4